MSFDQEFLYFDIVIHAYWTMPEGLRCYLTTCNRRAPQAANDP